MLRVLDSQERPEIVVSDEEVATFVTLHATRAIQLQHNAGDYLISIDVLFQGQRVKAHNPVYFGDDMIVVIVLPDSNGPEYTFALMRAEGDFARWEIVGNVLIDEGATSMMHMPKFNAAHHLAEIVPMILA